jgi:hypothetical protein
MTTCKLCQKNDAIQNSHVVPDFVTRWMKRNSTTAKFRKAVNPNRRVQDTEKCELLCNLCEQRFSQYERYFAENVFKPVLQSYKPEVDYDERLLKFIISISWRLYAISESEMHWNLSQTKIEAQRTAENWRLYLLGVDKLEVNDNHLFMFRVAKDAPIIPNTTVDLNVSA